MTTKIKQYRFNNYLFLIPALVFIFIYYCVPVIKSLQLSFQNYGISSFYTGKSPYIGFHNYTSILGSPLFLKALLNTAIFTGASIIFQFAIGLLLAMLFRKEFPGSSVIQGLLLAPWLISLMAAGTVWRWIMDADNGVLNQFLNISHVSTSYPGWLVDTKFAMISIIVVNVWLGIPFNAVILSSGIKEIPDELFEAGQIDGASGFKLFRHITWPLLRPVTTVVLMLGVVYTLKVLDVILVTTGGGPAESTETIATRAYQYSFVDYTFGKGAAMNNVLIIISLLFAFLYLRLNRRGAHE
jgi:multiple sugar transport system permease protein